MACALSDSTIGVGSGWRCPREEDKCVIGVPQRVWLQTSVNRGLLGALRIILKILRLSYEKKWCEYSFKDFDGLCAGTVSRCDTTVLGRGGDTTPTSCLKLWGQ